MKRPPLGSKWGQNKNRKSFWPCPQPVVDGKGVLPLQDPKCMLPTAHRPSPCSTPLHKARQWGQAIAADHLEEKGAVLPRGIDGIRMFQDSFTRSLDE